MKDLKNLKGAKMLSKMEQKVIKGGKIYCGDGAPCPTNYRCIGIWCEGPYIGPIE